MSLSFLKKITTQTMGFQTRQLEVTAEEHQPKPVSIMRVWGMVSGKTPGVSQYGPYMKFTGEIAALNLITGDEARSQALLLPGIAEAVVISLFDRATKEGGSAQIALEVTVTYNNSAKGGTKFAYGVKPLVEFKGEDALSVMAKQLPPPALIDGSKPAAKKKS
jgi:hypothetical protein